jgi:hypothetical protein
MSIGPSTTADGTSIDASGVLGVDLGTRNLIVAATTDAEPYADGCLEIDGVPVREILDELGEIVPGATDEIDQQIVDVYERIMRSKIESAVDRLIERAVEEDVQRIGIERLSYSGPTPLWEHLRSKGDKAQWILPVVKETILTEAEEAGFEVVEVDPHSTSRICAWCGSLGVRGRENVLHCNNDDCVITGCDPDRSAAVVVGKRAISQPQPETH